MFTGSAGLTRHVISLQAQDGKLGQSTMTVLHAAMQDYVTVKCEQAGKPPYDLREQADYRMVYKYHCTKTASRAEGNNSDTVHYNIGLDEYTNLCHTMLLSDKKEHLRNMAIILYQFSTVSRGDDVRPRRLNELMVRMQRAVGESMSNKQLQQHL